MTSPVGRLPTSMTGSPGMRISAYRASRICSRRNLASTDPAPSSRLSTMLASRTASRSTRSWAVLLMVRVSTMTSETPKTAITTSTTASVDWISRRRMSSYPGGPGAVVGG